MKARLDVALGERSYPIEIAPSYDGLGAALIGLGARRVVVVSNPVVARLVLPTVLDELAGAALPCEAVLVPDGESTKTLVTWQRLVTDLLALGVDRHTWVVALGGGVTGDLAGFAAATALRGLPFAQLPTTLLAMVDSSVGGKTGVNMGSGKNLVGAFHQPRLVWAALDTLATLPPPELQSGLAEGIKHGLVADLALWEWCETNAVALTTGRRDALGHLVLQSARIKAGIVAADEREAGVRGLLNFGHTAGHALEAALGPGHLRHGQCVALGMVAECRAARASGALAPDAEDRVSELCLALGLPREAPPVPFAALVDASRMDKKRAHGIVHAPVPTRLGHAEMRPLEATEVERMLSFLAPNAAPLED